MAIHRYNCHLYTCSLDSYRKFEAFFYFMGSFGCTAGLGDGFSVALSMALALTLQCVPVNIPAFGYAGP